MEFLKERCYSALNADELRAGDKVVVADDMASLRTNVEDNQEPFVLMEVLVEDERARFRAKKYTAFNDWLLAYLVERAENCTNCGRVWCDEQENREHLKVECCNEWMKPKEPKTEQKAEKHYRPFKDTLEMLKCWYEKTKEPPTTDADCLSMPHIWVRLKDENAVSDLITGFGEKEVSIDGEVYNFEELMNVYEFLDGTPCGVEE